MIDYAIISGLNDRSRLFNGADKAIWVKEVDEESPYIIYRLVNSNTKKTERVSALEFLTKLATMEIYAVNLEKLSEFLDCYDIVGAELVVNASYSEKAGMMYVSVFSALLQTFMPYELMGDKVVEKITERVIDACAEHGIPMGTNGKDIIMAEISRCIKEDIMPNKAMPLREYAISEWLEDEQLFSLE